MKAILVNDQQNASMQLIGDLSSMHAIRFRKYLLDFIDNNDLDLTIDLNQINDIDLGGFNALILGQRKLEQKGKTLKLNFGYNLALREFMALTKIDGFLLN
ncbi:MAG: hypothetical protein DWQ02_24585 [Bacteroidetes bacterium]|nr:MAG: hypothetical protein DWQ02_24585 [Bacteroidota bacterium]